MKTTADAAAGVQTPRGRIRLADPTAEDGWDGRLPAAATFFHSSAWTRVLRDAYGFSPCHLVAEDDHRVRGVLPLMAAHSWLTGSRGVSLPFTDSCESLADSDDLARLLFNAAVDHGKRQRWRYCELRGGGNRLGAPASASYLGHSLPLSPNTRDLFSRIASPAQRAVRRAERSGLSIEFSRSFDALVDFRDLLCRTRQRHGLPPQPLRFFESLHRHALSAGLGWVVLARLGKQPVAGAVFLHFRRHAVFKYGASNEAYQELRPNNLVLWRAIERHASEGFEVLDLGRTDIGQEGLRRFKMSWGATEHRIEYVRCDCRTGRFLVQPDRVHGWHNLLFRILPRPLSRLIGAAAYRHVA